MSAKKADNHDISLRAFLSCRGPNPIPESKRGGAGPLEKKFVDEAMREIAEQDRANERKAASGVAGALVAAMRLVSDNHEMIQLIQSRRASTVSDVAVAMGREPSNVSRTLSRMADIAKIQSLVQESIGIDDDRGDTLQVINMAFLEQKIAEESSLPLWRDPYLVEIGVMALKWLLIIGGFLWLAKQARRVLGTLAQPPIPVNALPAGDDEEPGSTAPALDMGALRQAAQNNPQAVDSVIKGWVEGDGNE